jgi:hypothetical protein
VLRSSSNTFSSAEAPRTQTFQVGERSTRTRTLSHAALNSTSNREMSARRTSGGCPGGVEPGPDLMTKSVAAAKATTAAATIACFAWGDAGRPIRVLLWLGCD